MAISLMKATDVARNALMACLVISADSTAIHSILSVIGASSAAARRRSSSDAHAHHHPVRSHEDFDRLSQAQVLRRAAKAYSRAGKAGTYICSKRAVEPTGICEAIKTNIRPRRCGNSRTTRWTTNSTSARSSSSTGVS